MAKAFRMRRRSRINALRLHCLALLSVAAVLVLGVVVELAMTAANRLGRFGVCVKSTVDVAVVVVTLQPVACAAVEGLLRRLRWCLQWRWWR